MCYNKLYYCLSRIDGMEIKMDKNVIKKIYFLVSVAALVTLFFFIVLRFDDNTFAKFSYEVNEDGVSATVSGFDGSNGSIDIPEEIDGYKVVAISDHAFANKEKLKKVSIPDSVEVIGKYAFDNCTSLKEVKIGKNVREIGHYAFYGCKMLKSADLPEKLESVGDFAFCSCIRLEKIKIPASCTVIGTDAFAACESLVMDCSENTLALDVANTYNIPTGFRESGDYLLIKVIVLTLLFGALTLAAVIVLPKIIKKSKKSQ